MFSVKELLKNLNVQPNNFSYVYFDKETGKIQKVSSRKTDEGENSVLEVPNFEVESIISGKKKTEDYHVIYDLATKKLTLKEITYENSLDSISNKLYELPTYRISTNEYGDRRSIVFEEIYEGVDVFLWIKDFSYTKNSLVWYNNNVWKLNEDNLAGQDFNTENNEIFIKNVIISDVTSLNQKIDEAIAYEPIYEGIHVDVWYNELVHLAGQHVWYNGNVYKIKQDQDKIIKEDIIAEQVYKGIHIDVWYDELEHLEGQHVWYDNAVYKMLKTQKADTNFDKKNTEILLENVKLYDDNNKSLVFEKEVNAGDLILDNNKIFLVKDIKRIENIKPIKPNTAIGAIPQYRGIHIDVWYDELEHLEGQHVWYDNAVYKMLNNLDANNKFDEKYAEAIVENVKLYDDENKHLPFSQEYDIGDLILDNNRLFMVEEIYDTKEKNVDSFDFDNAELILENIKLYDDKNKTLKFSKNLNFGDKILDNNKLFLYTTKTISQDIGIKSINFYTSKKNLIVYNEVAKNFISMSLVTKDNLETIDADIESVSTDLKIVDLEFIKKGQKVLIGKSLYIAKPLDDHDFDINIIQNNRLGTWEVYLNKKTKDFLINSSYKSNSTLYFSVTAKHDPNILYRSLKFSLNDLIKDKTHRYKFEHDWEFEKQEVSVYTPKFFDTYAHEIIE